MSTHFNNKATVDNLQCELKNLAREWDRRKASPLEEYMSRTADKNDEEEVEILHKSCTSCKNCPLCCYQILSQFNFLTDAYHLIRLGYKFLLTLSITQVACEHTFSTLKYIKSRLRSTLSQDHLEDFMLMATEKDVLMHLDTDTVINRVAEKTALLTKLLI